MATKPSHMGAHVNLLAFFLHHPTVCNCEMWGQSFLTGTASSHRATVASGTFPGGGGAGGLKCPGLDI
jgi:hypothetical protein